jgi:hypothetical protein
MVFPAALLSLSINLMLDLVGQSLSFRAVFPDTSLTVTNGLDDGDLVRIALTFDYFGAALRGVYTRGYE